MANNKDFKVKNGIQPTVYHEGLGTVTSGSVGYSLSSASYDSVSYSFVSQSSFMNGFFLDSTGTRLYLASRDSGTETVYQYSLSTAYDLTTVSYTANSVDVSSVESFPRALYFKDDGTKMYVFGSDGDGVSQYSLTTAWDVSTASYDSVSLVGTSQDSDPIGGTFSSDGTKVYLVGNTNDSVYQYSLSTAWDLSTASYDSISLSVSSQEATPFTIHFNSSGSRMYLVGSSGVVYKYNLSTGYNLSTATYASESFNITSQESSATNVWFNADETKMYIIGETGDAIYQYSTVLTTNTLDLSTGSVFEITPTSDIQINLSNPADSGTVSQATLLLDGGAVSSYDLANAAYDSVSFSVVSQSTDPVSFVFNNAGTKFFLLQINGSVYQYSLSTAWDVSTASYDSVSFDPTTQMTNPYALEFANAGSKMYIQDYYGPVYEYTLSTAYDLSTASYSSNSYDPTEISTQGYGVTFNPDGTKFYALSATEDAVFQYTLSTAYNISTASYDSKSLSVASQDTIPYEIRFNDDGTSLFVLGLANDTVYQYNLTTAYDISTASYASISFSVTSQDDDPRGMTFGNNGTKLYISGRTTDTIYQYSTATPATITYPSTLEWPSGTAPTSPAIGETDVLTFSTTDGGTTYQAVQAIDGAS